MQSLRRPSKPQTSLGSRAPNWPRIERRSRNDRRERGTRGWDAVLGWRRRRAGRREGENRNSYVDVYGAGDVMLLAGVFLLNILDAFFTLRWLQLGGTEANPLMDQLLQTHDLLFLFQKCFVVGIWLLILMVHKNFKVARLGLWMIMAIYAGLLVYHFVLQVDGGALAPAPLPR